MQTLLSFFDTIQIDDATAIWILLGGLVGIVVVTLVVHNIGKHFRSRCKSCKAQYNFDKDVKWEPVSTRNTQRGSYSTVKFTCTCPNCGKVKTFKKEYCLVSRTSGSTNSYSLNDLVRQDFK